MKSTPVKASVDASKKRIASGLSRCIVEKGYAQTKLIDVADACDISASLIRYYFKNKESILEFQYERLVAQFGVAVARLDQPTSAAWLRALADMLFDDGRAAQQNLLILMEANVVMARSSKMLELKIKYEQQILSAIEDKLKDSQLPHKQNASTTAQNLFDLLSGLMINVALEPGRYQPDACERFCKVASILTDISLVAFKASR